jgi:DeoR/GlpR family transcriptional regulator of sugar metabolism
MTGCSGWICLAAQLKQDDLCTMKGLARQHGVSERTIARDLSLMRERDCRSTPTGAAVEASGSTPIGASGG